MYRRCFPQTMTAIAAAPSTLTVSHSGHNSMPMSDWGLLWVLCHWESFSTWFTAAASTAKRDTPPQIFSTNCKLCRPNLIFIIICYVLYVCLMPMLGKSVFFSEALFFIILLCVSVDVSRPFAPATQQEICGTHLHAQDAEDDEKGTADENNVADGSQRWQQCLHHQLQAWSSADHSVKPKPKKSTSTSL